MVALLFYITYSRLMKLLSDETTLSQSFQNEVELPSFTICSYLFKESKKPKMDEKTTFDDFMEKATNIKNLIIRAEYQYGPAVREK